MERTLCLLDSAARRSGRKRQRRQPTPPVSEASAETTPPAADERLDEGVWDEGVWDEGVQQRLKDAVHTLARDRHRSTYYCASRAAFAARTAVGAWLAVQAVKPQQFGLEWAAQLYVCFFLATGAYSAGPESFGHLEMLQVDDLAALLTLLGRSSAADTTPSAAEQRLMKTARQWSRVERRAVGEAMVKASQQMSGEKRVRLAVEGVLFNAHRASHLFA